MRSLIAPSILLFAAAIEPTAWAADADRTVSRQDCTFAANPDRFLAAHERVRADVYNRTRSFRALASDDQALAAAVAIPRRNFIDDEIFGRLAKAGVTPARLSSDEEFLRRIYLDLTGRIPSASDIRDFASNTDSGKRDQVIDRLIASPEFVDKWTMWFGDLFQNTSTRLSTQALPRTVESRNAFQRWLRNAIANEVSIRDLAWATIDSSGNTFDANAAGVNFILGGQAAMGPVQDSYDMMMVKAASAFLGVAHYDCLSCHNGTGHLDTMSLWAKNTKRMDAWKMSAFFSRARWTTNTSRDGVNVNPKYNSVELSDVTSGQYDLNTNSGNRPARCADQQPVDQNTGRCAATGRVTPVYRTGATPQDGNWRAAFADNLTRDPMFGRNFANRLWKAMFNLGLVDPVETLDPLRLDPANPPPPPWSLQATHPELLQKLADFFVNNNTSLRDTLRLIAQSSAYQLSSRYDGEWKYEYITLFARHYPRRLDAEEIHDAIVKATGMVTPYTWPLNSRDTIPAGSTPPVSDPVNWAMQLPDTVEGGRAAAFLNTFLRGNRDTQLRSDAGSILQQLALMNDANNVLARIRIGNSPVLREIANISGSRNDEVVNTIFLTFLSRQPSAAEAAAAASYLTNAKQRNTAIEDLAWAAINKIDFIFSY